MTVRLQQPGLGVVFQVAVQVRQDAVGQFFVGYREANFHAPEHVAVHQVGAGCVDGPIPAVHKCIDASVLQEAADQSSDLDIVGDAGNARPQAANAAHDQLDFDACLRCPVQGLDALLLDDGVGFDDDFGRLAFFGLIDFLVDHFHQTMVQRERRL